MTWLVLAILALALLRTPLFVVVFLLCAVLFPTVEPRAMHLPDMFILVFTNLFSSEFLAPIPLFTFAGFLLASSKSPERLVRLADALLGWLPGGLAIVAVCTLAFFTAFTGASGVTIIALGGLLWPLLLERGYSEQFSLGVVTASGSIGLLFFPSLPIFLYVAVNSISGGQPVEPEALFLAGLLPGLLMVGALSAYSFRRGRAMKVQRQPFSSRAVWPAFRGAIWEVTLPIWLLALLVSGKIGLDQIPYVTVLYIFVVVVVIKRDIRFFKDVPRIAADSAALVGAIVVVLVMVVGLNDYLSIEKVAYKMVAFLRANVDSPFMMLLTLNVLLLVVGCMMDIFSAMAAVLPLLIPLAEAYEISPLHLGIIFLANLEVGYLTPPVGMNLFISSLHFKKPLLSVARSILPWMGILLATVMIITYVPALSTWLPETFGYETAARVRVEPRPVPLDDEKPAPAAKPGSVEDELDMGDDALDALVEPASAKPKSVEDELEMSDDELEALHQAPPEPTPDAGSTQP